MKVALASALASKKVCSVFCSRLLSLALWGFPTPREREQGKQKQQRKQEQAAAKGYLSGC